jgi:7-keto-8-aminopelargonate synthetase-like enzyme
MDGDICDLPSARALADEFNGILILDEAHALGTIGKTGRGCEEHHEYKVRADIICGSLTKSLGSLGGYIVCSDKLRIFYAFHAHGAVFSAPLSAFNTAAAIKALDILDSSPQLVTKL